MSCREIARVAAVLLSLGVALNCDGQTQEAKNLLRNGGFEEGLDAWAKPKPGKLELIEDEAAAHSGKRCVAGEVEKMSQFQAVAQDVDLEASRVYRLSFWMRSPQRARSIIHLLYGKGGTIELLELRQTDKRWRKYETMLSPRETGTQTLRFAIPSSFGPFGKPGQVFLDDIELTAVPGMAPPLNITNNDGFNDWPTMAADGAGNIWTAWISFAEGVDKLKACLIRNGNVRTFDIAAKCDGNIIWPYLAPCSDGAWLLWAMEVNHAWDIYTTKLTGEGASDIVRVTNDPSVAVKVCGAVDGSGRLWIAWESNKDGGRDIYATSFSNGKVADAVKLTDNPTSDQNPAICAADSGEVYVAWDSFRDSNYDIYMRRYAGGQWGAEVRLTDDPVVDRQPYLASFRDGVWLVWDSTMIQGYRMSARIQKTVGVGKIVGDRLLMPGGIFDEAMLHKYAELGALTMDGEGRLWVAMKRARGQRGDWDTWVQCYSGEKWSEPILASGGLDGVERRASIACVNGKLHLVWQSDDRPNRPERIGYTGEQNSNIFYATLDPSACALAAAAPALSEYKTEEQLNSLAEYRTRFNEDVPEHFTIDYKGEKLSLYWGIFHEHTELSQCNARGDGLVDTNFAEARDIARLDFAALTDHGQDMIPYDWHYLRKVVSVNQDPGRFLTYLAEEWAGARKNLHDPERSGGYGHRNIIFANEHYPRYFDPIDNTPPDELWKTLKNEDQITIPHQLADGGSRTDWFYVDDKNQPVAEIFQNRGSYEYFGAPRQARIFTKGFSLQDQWASGTIIGVIASPDHGGGGGKAAIFAPELTRASILDACRKRRTYGTTAAKIFMDVRVNEHLMGEAIQVPADRTVAVSVKVIGAGNIKQVEVAKDNKFVHTVSPGGKTAEFVFEDTQPRQKRSFYYVRVIQDDDEIAWSSPVWVE